MPEEPKVVAPPPPPPKPQPKPTKFSILQIRDFINKFSKEELEAHASAEVVAKAKEIGSWKCEEVDVKAQEDDKRKNNRDQNKKYDNKNNNYLRTGVKKDEAEKAVQLGYAPKAESNKVGIVLGAKETIEARQMKEEIKKKKGLDFATLKMKEESEYDDVKRARVEIVYNLNLIVPENLKDIEKDLFEYLIKTQ